MISAYLPSKRFVTMASALLAATALVVSANQLTKKPTSGSIVPTPEDVSTDPNWEQTLQKVQLESGITAPKPAPEATVQEFLAEAESGNVTATIGKSLLVKLSSAGVEGLGSDIPTQEAIIAEAAAKAEAKVSATYSSGDLIRTSQTKDSLKAYGNSFITTMIGRPAANSGGVLFAFGEALDYRTTAKLTPIRAAADAYTALASDLAALPVPETLSPIHLQIVNNIAAMGSGATEMLTVLDDPLRALGGLTLFQSKADETNRLLTAVAKMLRESGIIFNNDDPGAAWSTFVASP